MTTRKFSIIVIIWVAVIIGALLGSYYISRLPVSPASKVECAVAFSTKTTAVQKPLEAALIRPIEVTFKVQNQDMAVKVLRPYLDESSTPDYPVIIGFPTIFLTNEVEYVGAPQCHWDGIHEDSKWSFTIYYRVKGGSDISSRQINLRDFMSTSTTPVNSKEKRLNIVHMGIIADGVGVNFSTIPLREMLDAKGKDPRDFIAK